MSRELWIAGTFDFWHEGHCQLLADAGRLSDDVTVWINDKHMINERKGISVSSNNTRAQGLKEMGFKVEILLNLEQIKKQLIINKPILLHGDDYDIKSLSELYGVDELWWRHHGILPIFSPRQAGMSSTELRKTK